VGHRQPLAGPRHALGGALPRAARGSRCPGARGGRRGIRRVSVLGPLRAAVLACLLAIGGVVFGRATVGAGAHRCAALLLGAGTLGALALALAAGIAEPLGFKALCARIQSDASLAGTPRVGAFVALVVLVLPALAAGTAAHLARRRTTLAAMLLGAGLGVAAAPGLLEVAPVAWMQGDDAAGSAGLVRLGALITGVGALLHAALQPGAGRVGLAGVSIGVLVGSALLPVSPVPVLDPWERFPVQPIALFETPDGQFAVEPTGSTRRRVTLDQRELSPRSRASTSESSAPGRGSSPARRHACARPSKPPATRRSGGCSSWGSSPPNVHRFSQPWA